MKRKSARSEKEVVEEVVEIEKDEVVQPKVVVKSVKSKDSHDGKIRYKNNGGLFYPLSGPPVKSGEIFWSRPGDIPSSVKDIIKALDPIKETPPLVVANPEYKITPCNYEEDKFNIVDCRGKILNETALAEDAAKVMLARLLE